MKDIRSEWYNKTYKKINQWVTAFIIILVFFQGYEIYKEQSFTFDINQVVYQRLLTNVMPSTVLVLEKNHNHFLQQIIYAITDININNYQSLLLNHIPLLKYGMLLSQEEYGEDWIHLKNFKVDNSGVVSEDYFDQSEELAIVSVEEDVIVDQFVTREQLEDKSYVVRKLINFDANLNNENQAINEIDAASLSEKKLPFNHQVEGPKVLIFHTHSMEKFADEQPESKGVVDVGRYLKQILETQYGIDVLHCTSSFDVVDGIPDRDASYERMEPEIECILKENPTIQLVIDLHRDGVEGDYRLVTKVNGKDTARIMFVNGLCKVQKKGLLTPIKNLPNPYIEDNMALSLQLQLRANQLYPGFMRKTLVKPYRYSLHMKPMSVLVEVGAQTNTKEEAMNAMEPFAEVIIDVLEKD